jgi:hypothetical protein
MDEYQHWQKDPMHSQQPHYPGLEQLMAAALANPEFATELLANPAQALPDNKYGIELSEEEFALATAIQNAADIHDYAIRLREHIKQQRNP